MKTFEVNEDANYRIELLVGKEWKYITTEYSISVASTVMINIHNATKLKGRVLSIRSDNMVLSEI
mgnify:CR=1 FL=1